MALVEISVVKLVDVLVTICVVPIDVVVATNVALDDGLVAVVVRLEVVVVTVGVTLVEVAVGVTLVEVTIGVMLEVVNVREMLVDVVPVVTADVEGRVDVSVVEVAVRVSVVVVVVVVVVVSVVEVYTYTGKTFNVSYLIHAHSLGKPALVMLTTTIIDAGPYTGRSCGIMHDNDKYLMFDMAHVVRDVVSYAARLKFTSDIVTAFVLPPPNATTPVEFMSPAVS